MRGLSGIDRIDWRSFCLRGLLMLMALSTLNALRIVATQWPAFVAAFPGASSDAGRLFAILLPLALLVGLAGLWRWRRWALWWLVVVAAATLIFDVATHGPWRHAAAAVVSMLSLGGAIWLNRNRFAARAVTVGEPTPP